MRHSAFLVKIRRLSLALAAAVALNCVATAGYDFDRAWERVENAQRKGLPRTVTNELAEIERAAVSERRWPDAARAFLVREEAMRQFTDELPQDWLPAFAASVDAQPPPLQAVLQLHLAHTYQANSRRRRWGGAAPTKLDGEAAKDKMPPWSPEKIAATLEAQFAKVFAHSDELKAMKLDDWKILFKRGTWPAQYCPTLFDFAVRDAIEFYGRTIPDKTLEKGLALCDSLVEFHRADGNLDAQTMAELQRAEYIRAFDEKPDKAREAAFAAFLDGFLKEYEGRTETVAYAASLRAGIMRGGKELAAAHDLAAAYAAKWPKSPGGKMCANIVAEIEAKSLAVEVERNWCAPWPQIEVSAKNLDKVHFRLVRIGFDNLVEDTSMGENAYNGDARNAMANRYLKIAPAKEWTEKLDLKPGFGEQRFSCPVPQDLPCGHYVLFAAVNDKFGADKHPLYAQYVTVTTLALAMKTGNGEFGGTVYRAESGEPVEGAKVELWGYPQKGGRFEVLRETYVTDRNGEFRAKVARKGEYNALNRHVRVVHDGAEVLSLGNEGSGSVHEDDRSVEFIDLFTDRSLYRPGQEIRVKGIAYHADPFTRDFRTQTNMTVRLTLCDPNGKEVASTKLRPNKWGSFAHAFTAPTDRLTGSYKISAWYLLVNGRRGEGRALVSVEEYKRPKFTASFEGAPEKAELGKPVTVAGKALTYSGLPVQNARVEWRVERSTLYPGWWSWLGFALGNDGGEGLVAAGVAETDADGVFRVTFTPVAAPTADLSGDPSFQFRVEATVTDETGEARGASESFEIGTVAWRANVWVDGAWHTPEKGVPVRVAVHSLTGAKLPARGTLKAFRMVAPERPVRRPAAREYGYNGRKGPWDWKRWDVGEEVASIDIDDDVAQDRHGVDGRARIPAAPSRDGAPGVRALPLPVGAYRLVFETKDPNGKTVKDITHVCVFDPKAKRFALAVPNFFCAEKTTVKVGETMRAYWGTGYDTGFVRIRVTSNRKVILDEMREATSSFYELPIKDEHRGEIRIETTFVRENRLYADGTTVNVPWDSKQLDIKAEHLASKLTPGRDETWKFKVSGPAEVLALMYDRSLDAYKWHGASAGFSSHFTPWTRYMASPTLQNKAKSLYRLGGRFRVDLKSASFIWPTWKTAPSRYGGMVLQKARRGPSSEMPGEVVAESAGCMDLCAAPAPAACRDAEEATEVGMASDGGEGSEAAPRKNLKETAFFFPDLETDADGNVSLTFTVPDALTGWKLLMVAHDNELRSGVLRNDEIVTVKPLMCEPNAPRFAREGDDFLFAVKVTNTEDAPQKGVVELALEELGREGKGGSGSRPASLPSQPFSLAPHESRVFEFRVAIPDGCGYLKYVAKARGGKFTDGEEGVLPVLSRRVLVREAVQLNVRGNATKSFRLDNLLASRGSDTIRHEDLTVRAVSRPAWYAVLSLPYLMEFPHECCEQTFSRYYANALGAYMANSDPRIRATFDAWKAAGGEALKSPLETDPHLRAVAIEATPWVREAAHESAARARLGELFGDGRLRDEQASCIKKLDLSRNGNGLWPWFPGGPSSDAITLHILTGFARLNHLAGVAYPDFFASAAEALDRRVSEDVRKRLYREKNDGIPFRVDGFDVRWMYLHSFAGVGPSKDKTPESRFVEHIRDEWTGLGLESQALAAIAMKRRGDNALAGEIMASVKERGVLSEELGMYWKVPHFFSSSVFAAPVSTQALVVEAFREVTGDEESAEACNVWLLKQKQTQDWTTTAANADAIYALLLGGGADLLAGDRLAGVTLGGVQVPVVSPEAGTGMYSHRYSADEIRPEMGEIAFTGAGEKGVAWGGVHWSYFEDVVKVRAHEPRELRVEKKYYKKVRGPDGVRLTSIDGGLEPGDELVARLEIASDRTYEFVHLSDERPACAEPVDVLSSYRWRDGVGYYQSTRDTATHYYIDRLNKGVFVLETSYRVQQRGVFSGGLATIQCMYAPEFTAHSSAERVAVAR